MSSVARTRPHTLVPIVLPAVMAVVAALLITSGPGTSQPPQQAQRAAEQAQRAALSEAAASMAASVATPITAARPAPAPPPAPTTTTTTTVAAAPPPAPAPAPAPVTAPASVATAPAPPPAAPRRPRRDRSDRGAADRPGHRLGLRGRGGLPAGLCRQGLHRRMPGLRRRPRGHDVPQERHRLSDHGGHRDQRSLSAGVHERGVQFTGDGRCVRRAVDPFGACP